MAQFSGMLYNNVSVLNEEVCTIHTLLLIGRQVSQYSFIGVDYIALLAALQFSVWVRNLFFVSWGWVDAPTQWNDTWVFFLIPAIYLSFLASERMYEPHRFLWKRMKGLARACFFATLVLSALNYFISGERAFSRSLLLLSAFSSFFFLFGLRYLIKHLLVRAGLWQIPVLVVGAGKTAELLNEVFIQDPNMGYRIIGLLEDFPEDRALAHHYPVLGRFDDAERVIREHHIQSVILATPGLSSAQQIDMLRRIQHEVRDVAFIPDLFGLPVGNLEIETFFDQKLVLLRTHNNMASWLNRGYKWLLDAIGALVGLFIFLPVYLILSILIYIDSPGPIIFSHRRVGQGGQEFPCYKFRTMVPNAHEELHKYLATHPEYLQEWESSYKLKDDPRITRIGRWLRKTSLDELPQFLNVLKGEMSLVGPRPIIQDEIVKYGEFIEDFYQVKPGITGLWQVSGRNDIAYEDRVRMDSWYVRNWSVWLDLVILLKTVRYVWSGRGAY